MPLYIFENNKTGESREIFFEINSEKVYNGENGDEIGIWDRCFGGISFSVSTPLSKIDPYDKKAFSTAISEKKGTIGEMIEASKELSMRREQKDGKDLVKEKGRQEYKERVGKESVFETREKGEKRIKELGFDPKTLGKFTKKAAK